MLHSCQSNYGGFQINSAIYIANYIVKQLTAMSLDFTNDYCLNTHNKMYDTTNLSYVLTLPGEKRDNIASLWVTGI